MFDDTVEKLGHALRLACPPIQTGVDNGRDLNLATLRARGITVVGRFLAANGHTVTFADDLQATATGSDQAAIAIRKRVDDFIRERGLDAPDPEPFEPAGRLQWRANDPEPERSGYQQRDLGEPASGSTSAGSISTCKASTATPEQTQGVSPHKGLYFMGLQLMHTRKSGLIFGVGEDAEHVSA